MTETSGMVALYASAPHDCSYLDGQTAVNHYIDPSLELSPEIYGVLLSQGFRRSGDHVYRPACPNCQACKSSRVAITPFKMKRSQRRIWNKNKHDIVITQHIGEYNDERFDLYKRYLNQQHPDGGMSNSSAEDFSNFLTSEWCETRFIEFRLQGELIAVAVTDITPSGLSALYTFYAPEQQQRSLGVFSILSQIQLCKEMELPRLYLGYWIEECRKMRYKAEYQPLEVFNGESWVRQSIIQK